MAVAESTLRGHRVATFIAQKREQAHRQASAQFRIFQSDFAYWVVSRLFKRWTLTLLGAPGAAVVDAMRLGQWEAIGRFIDDMI